MRPREPGFSRQGKCGPPRYPSLYARWNRRGHRIETSKMGWRNGLVNMWQRICPRMFISWDTTRIVKCDV